MNLENKSTFFCKECNAMRSTCAKDKGICSSYISFILEKNHTARKERETKGEMTVSDCVMLHGRIPTLIILGEKEMAGKLKDAEKFVKLYRDIWDKLNLSELEISNWIDKQDNQKRKIIRDTFNFYTREVGLYLSDRANELI